MAAAPNPGGAGEVAIGTRLVTVPAGRFVQGNPRGDGDPTDGESPSREVELGAYRIAVTAVTNDEFGRFVAATRHRTVAEAMGDSFVFAGLLPDDFPPTQAVARAPWWRLVEGADWSHPEGPQSDLAGRGDHPVVHVVWDDAQAFCRWSGTRLPTETEWERAARGGRPGLRFPWGDDLEPDGEHRMNVFQGTFPGGNSGADGWLGTCPVDAYPPNDLGLHNTTGNVWEWCEDWFHPQAYVHDRDHEPRGPVEGTARVMRGGSYLCHESYCTRYRVDARSSSPPDSTTGNLGFRIASEPSESGEAR